MCAENQNTILRAIGPDACLTIEALANETGLKRKAISQACSKLVTRGFVDRVETGCFQLTEGGKLVFENNANLSSAPIGPRVKPRKHAKSMRIRIWRAIRMKRKFTISDIVTLASKEEKAPRDGVQRYLCVLSQAGYLHRLKQAGKARRYSLIRDLGPEAPIIRNNRTEVYDPNTEETYPCLQR
jgi:predicted transcriptional regulator